MHNLVLRSQPLFFLRFAGKKGLATRDYFNISIIKSANCTSTTNISSTTGNRGWFTRLPALTVYHHCTDNTTNISGIRSNEVTTNTSKLTSTITVTRPNQARLCYGRKFCLCQDVIVSINVIVYIKHGTSLLSECY